MGVAAVLAAGTAAAEPLADAEAALRRGDYAGALRVLEPEAGKNPAVKGRLASYLRNFNPPYRNVARACTLAREAAEAGDPTGLLTRAECLATGAENAKEPFALARDLARRAAKAGHNAGGFTLYYIQSLDPKYAVAGQGQEAMARYQALAALPVAARAEQIEAIEGLGESMRLGYIQAFYTGIAYLQGSSAPGNLDRMLRLAEVLQRNGFPVPEYLKAGLGTAQFVRGMGDTHASATAFRDASKAAYAAATLQLRTPACDAKDLALVRVTAGALRDAEYLPLKGQPLAQSYLLRGAWDETWTFAACQKTVPVSVQFTADGWSGARFAVRPPK